MEYTDTKLRDFSIYLSYILRHAPDDIHVNMDIHGWVDVSELIDKINTNSHYTIDKYILERIVVEDDKQRYKFNDIHTRIKACQGHSLPWVTPELEYKEPPEYLYHGTTHDHLTKIYSTGYISKMKRHGVHMTADLKMAKKSAKRWKHEVPLVLKIDAKKMSNDGFVFGVSENSVWITEKVPTEYITEVITFKED